MPRIYTPTTTTSNRDTPKPLKRRHSSITDLPYFPPATESFQSAPYPKPKSQQPAPPREPLPMDPSPSDPHAVFIHAPFRDFPDAHLYEGGLTFLMLQANPEWFLVPEDFKSEYSPHTGITYPAILEPPRGWCPTSAKKQDSERSADEWSDEEDARLRCTFCRRTYAGVNAKSMWRRHILEKHKIAMANRREAQSRSRGRSKSELVSSLRVTNHTSRREQKAIVRCQWVGQKTNDQ